MIHLKKISSKEFALLIIFDLIYQYISEVYLNDVLFESNLSSKIIIRIIKILKKISDKKGFNENFFDMCGNKLINIILSPNWRNDVSILNEFSEFLINLNEDIKLPIQITQLLLFLITSKDDKAISNAIKLCNRFNENEISNVNELLIDYFDKEYEKEIVTPALVEIIKNVRSIFLVRRPNQMMKN